MVLVGDRRVGFDFLFGIDTPAVWFSKLELVSRNYVSWNRIAEWLNLLRNLRAVT